MALAPGTRIGPYEISSPLGKGGMGEVYRARDTKLQRDVAIKVLPEAWARDPERLARLEREAQILAALNHPHIAAIHGLEDTGAVRALVLEFVEGPTLAELIGRGGSLDPPARARESENSPLPVEEALSIARQIVDAVEAAHEQGIVHRDLKPANVKVRPDGTVKVLDFGLAKAVGGGAVSSDPHESPTVTLAATQAGLILGTAAYMSPEQASGKQTDKRTDIWSFGVVLWEMLTGAGLFTGGETTSHVLADVLRAPIDFTRIPQGPLRDLLRRCLDRDVKTRLRDIGEARVALARATSAASVTLGSETEGTLGARGAGTRLRVAWTAAAILALTTAVALWAPWRTSPERPLMRLDVDLGAGIALPAESYPGNFAISPDGTRVLYVASVAGSERPRLYTRPLNDDKALELPGTEGTSSATFSPDGQSIAFVKDNGVYRVSVEGGAAVRVSDTSVQRSLVTWVEDGSILVSGQRAGLRRIPAGGGDAVNLTELTAGETTHAQPHVLPGGETVLFASAGSLSDPSIEAVALSGGGRKVVVPAGTSPHYLPSGHLLYLKERTLFAVRFDPETLETRGDPAPIVTDVKTTFFGLVSVGTVSMAANGTLVYRRATGEPESPGPSGGRTSTVEWIDAAGRRSSLISTVGAYYDPRVSPDGGRIAFTILGPSCPCISVYDVRRDLMTRLTSDPGSVDSTWSRPDGRFLVFRSVDGLWWTRTDSLSQPKPLLQDGAATGSFTPDGTRLAYTVRTPAGTQGVPSGRSQIFTVAVTEDNGELKAGKPERFSPPQFYESAPEFSPDGRWIAFETDRYSGRREIGVRAFPVPASGQSFEVPISNNGGTRPRWFGPELLYQEGDQIMSVRYTVKGDTLVPDRPRVKIKTLGGTNWDVASDGRIVVVTPVEAKPGASAPPSEHTLVVLLNLADEVRRRLP